ncbi:MAG: glucans biosynthesis glucosyltransferase MdoH [Burkholderiaceae bacterium]
MQDIDTGRRGKDYLDSLPLDGMQRRVLSSHADTDPSSLTLAQAHHALAGTRAERDNPACGSIDTRLALAYGPAALAQDEQGSMQPTGMLPIAPPVNRTPIAPVDWGILNPVTRAADALLRRKSDWNARRPESRRSPWPAAQPPLQETDTETPALGHSHFYFGNVRRAVLLMLMLGQTAAATYYMRSVLPYQGEGDLEWLLLSLFALLFCWVSAGFWTAMAGFLVLLRGKDRYAISGNDYAPVPIPPNARTAIVMPICNEDATRVIAGLRATYESIRATGELDRFDFFILSDSSEGDARAAELGLWADLCKAVDGFGRIFYRHRKRRVKRKSGNIDDFCRRWGKNYRYMIVLDADSVMTGDCVTRLVCMMEAHPDAGIIQTAPVATGRETLYARIQQFSTRVYGPLFTAGLHYWQLGESHYWGHNAIIRLAPLMKHCVLSPLPGRGSLAGEILSHDFVEAALMRRAGWKVWIAYDLEGSYEEVPPNLLDELKRDRRWCHGNLMNFRLFTARGMHPVHRAVFATGVMAYLSAPIWLLFLLLSTVMLGMNTLIEPQYFQEPRQLFPIWPQWHPEKAIALFSATLGLLFLPKVLSVLLICLRGAKQYGGVLRVIASMVIEMLVSMLLAPVRMLFHTRFVLAAFLGIAIHWKSPPREDSETHWREALGKHGFHALLGVAWGAGIYMLNPALLLWILPIAGGLALSPLVSSYTSRVSLGRSASRSGLFVIPEEVQTPRELLATAHYVLSAKPAPRFADMVVDPALNALACSAVRARRNSGLYESLVRRTLHHAPESLSAAQQGMILDDAVCLSKLHLHAWSSEQMLAKWSQRWHDRAASEPAESALPASAMRLARSAS